MTTSRLALPELLQDTKSGYVTFNDLGRILDSTLSLSVQHYLLADPPATPAEGQCWYVPVGATGDWAGKDKTIAQWFNAVWYHYVPQVGAQVYVLSPGLPGYVDENGDIVFEDIPATSYRDIVIDDNPLSYWTLDDSAGSTLVDSVGGNDGSISGTYLLGQSPLIPDRASIDVTDAHMTASLSASGDTYSIEAWVKPHTTNTGTHILMHESGIEFRVGVNLDFHFGATSHLNTTTLSLNQTYHCVLVVDAGVGTFYLDGAADGVVSGCPAFNPVNFFSSGADPLLAVVDEMAFYQSALTPGQVESHYLWGIGYGYKAVVLADSPIAYFTFDQAGGLILIDEMEAYDSAITGTPVDGAAPIPSGSPASYSLNNDTYVDVVFGSVDNDFAFEFWFEFQPTGGLQTILLESGRALYINIDRFSWYYGGGHNNMLTTLQSGQTYYVVVNAVAGVVTVYLDTLVDGTSSIDKFTPYAFLATNTSFFDSVKGRVDQFAFYDSSLTIPQINDHYNAGTL